MPESKNELTEEEFKELFESSTDEERLEICRVLANFVKKNRDVCEFTDEQIAEKDEQFDRYARVIEDKKRVAETVHKVKTALELTGTRINAHVADIAETASPTFFDDEKKHQRTLKFMPTKEEETRARLRKFLESCVKTDLAAEGERAIEIWERHLEICSEGIDSIYELTEADNNQIKAIINEYYQTREQEETEREQRRLAEERADEVLANHYADRIKKIVLAKPNRFFPKPKAKLSPRSKTH